MHDKKKKNTMDKMQKLTSCNLAKNLMKYLVYTQITFHMFCAVKSLKVKLT